MDNASAHLSTLIFGVGQRTGDGGLLSNAEGIIEPLTVYHWPKTALSGDSKLAVLAYMTSFGRSESVSPSAWATWAFSCLVLAFPEFVGIIRAQNEREYSFKPLTQPFVDALVAASAAAEEYDEDHPEVYAEAIARIPMLPNLPEVPRTAASFPPDLAAAATVPSVYGYAGLLFFLAGKKIHEKNSTTITEKRPMNLINAYDINDQAAFILTGDGKMGSAAHRYVNQAWVTYAPMRSALVSEAAKFGSGRSLPQRVVFTIVKMMEYAGMQQATFIHEFLQALPESVNFACIRPSYNAYITSLREVAAAPSYLQPYYKLMHGERTRAFHRNAILTLAACATAWKKHTTPSMVNFNLGAGATPAVNMYDAEASRKGLPTLQGLMVQEQETVEQE
jgi:hypothetical protein